MKIFQVLSCPKAYIFIMRGGLMMVIHRQMPGLMQDIWLIMNKVVMECYEHGTPVKMCFYKANEHKKVEFELLGQIHTLYNGK